MDCHEQRGLMELVVTAMMTKTLIEFPALRMSVAFRIRTYSTPLEQRRRDHQWRYHNTDCVCSTFSLLLIPAMPIWVSFLCFYFFLSFDSFLSLLLISLYYNRWCLLYGFYISPEITLESILIILIIISLTIICSLRRKSCLNKRLSSTSKSRPTSLNFIKSFEIQL